MRAHSPWYQIHRALLDHFSPVRPTVAHGLTLWVDGTLLAQSACESAVLTALAPVGKRETIRQRLRDRFRASADKRVPCHCDWAVADCFAPLLRWALSWWQGKTPCQSARGMDASLAAPARPACSRHPCLHDGDRLHRSWGVESAPLVSDPQGG